MYESPEDKEEYQEAPWKKKRCWKPQKEEWEKTIPREGLVWVRDMEVQNAGGEYYVGADMSTVSREKALRLW